MFSSSSEKSKGSTDKDVEMDSIIVVYDKSKLNLTQYDQDNKLIDQTQSSSSTRSNKIDWKLYRRIGAAVFCCLLLFLLLFFLIPRIPSAKFEVY